jgi:tetratricopeptide (TPR) repeat protein
MPIIIVDVGSTDNTIKICKDYGCSVKEAIFEGDYSKVRNSNIADGWNFYIQPWEILTSGHISLKNINSVNQTYRVRVLQSNMLTKEIRLWKNKKFENPIYETISGKAEIMDDVFIYSKTPKEDPDRLKIIEKWKKAQLSEPVYYEAMTYLAMGKYKEFKTTAQKYLFNPLEKDEHVAMLKYYLALVSLYVFKDASTAYTEIVPCIIAAPLMAEFWCLLGDILYRSNKYQEARTIYENALILGKHRLNDDYFPVDIGKYKDYPEKMMVNCEQMVKNSLSISPYAPGMSRTIIG